MDRIHPWSPFKTPISKIEIPQKLGFDSKSWIPFKNDSNDLITLYYD